MPWDKRLSAIDGETQLAARHGGKHGAGDEAGFIAVYINHGRGDQWARQAFHDLNTLGVRPNAALSLGMDARDPMRTSAARSNGAFRSSRTASARSAASCAHGDAEVLTITTLRGACVTLAKGINGVQFGARPVPLEKDLMAAVETAAIDWFVALTEAFGPAFANRDQSLASSPTAMAALGAIGNPLVHIEDAQDRALKARELVHTLRSVNWTRDKTWEGIAGKFTPKGASRSAARRGCLCSLRGALRPTSPGYARVRNTAASKAA